MKTILPMKIIIYFLFFLIPDFCAIAQKIRTQAEIRLVGDINFQPKRVKSGLSHFRLASSISPVIYLDKKERIIFVPVVSFNFLIGRGMGSSMRDKLFRLRPQAMISLVGGVQWGHRRLNHQVQMLPFFLQPGFSSDNSNIIALSSNMILIDRNRSINDLEFRYQRVGSIYIGTQFGLEASYINDGPPFGKWLGDGRDRYWTGSGFLGYKFKPDWKSIDNRPVSIRWSFDRYTSYKENAYELATALKMDYVPYRDFTSNLYNRGSMRIGVFVENLYSAELTINDSDYLDIQNVLHLLQGFSWHRTANKSSLSLQMSYSYLPKMYYK